MSFSFGHVFCVTRNLGRTVSAWREAGFTVLYGNGSEAGAPPAGVHNAFVRFGDGPFLELCRMPRSMRWGRAPLDITIGGGMGSRVHRWATGAPGAVDVALLAPTRELAAARSELRAEGMRIGRVIRSRRRLADGSAVGFEVMSPMPWRAPFVVSAYTGREPLGAPHPNGCQRIEEVVLELPAAVLPSARRLVRGERRLRLVEAEGDGAVGAVAIAGAPRPFEIHGVRVVPA